LSTATVAENDSQVKASTSAAQANHARIHDALKGALAGTSPLFAEATLSTFEALAPANQHPLSSDDYDDIAGHLPKLAKMDARAIDFNGGVAFRRLTFDAIKEALRLETVSREACSQKLAARYIDDLSPNDVERLAWKYLAALAMAKESEVRS